MDDKLYVQQVLFNNGRSAAGLYAFDGSTWTEEPAPKTVDGEFTSFVDPEVFRSNIVIRDQLSSSQISPMYAFDGDNLSRLRIPDASSHVGFWDHLVAHDRLIALTSDNRVIMTQDLEEWETLVDEVPDGARSIAVLGSDMYFGTVDSTLLRTSIAIPEPSSVCLVTTLILPLLFLLARYRQRKP